MERNHIANGISIQPQSGCLQSIAQVWNFELPSVWTLKNKTKQYNEQPGINHTYVDEQRIKYTMLLKGCKEEEKLDQQGRCTHFWWSEGCGQVRMEFEEPRFHWTCYVRDWTSVCFRYLCWVKWICFKCSSVMSRNMCGTI